MHRGKRIRQQLQPGAHTCPMSLCLADEFPELGLLFCPSLPPAQLQQPLQRMPLELESAMTVVLPAGIQTILNFQEFSFKLYTSSHQIYYKCNTLLQKYTRKHIPMRHNKDL